MTDFLELTNPYNKKEKAKKASFDPVTRTINEDVG